MFVLHLAIAQGLGAVFTLYPFQSPYYFSPQMKKQDSESSQLAQDHSTDL